MKLEQQVVSLELAKRLKELGVKQESLYVYYHNGLGDGVWKLGNWNEPIPPHVAEPNGPVVSAFTVAELGEMLPDGYISKRGDKHEDKWAVWDDRVVTPLSDKVMYADTEADARAKMLAYLLENKLMPIPDHDCHASSEDGCSCGRREV